MGPLFDEAVDIYFTLPLLTFARFSYTITCEMEFNFLTIGVLQGGGSCLGDLGFLAFLCITFVSNDELMC
jgi:hypothetical protein